MDLQSGDRGYEAGYAHGAYLEEGTSMDSATRYCPYSELDEMLDYDTWVSGFVTGAEDRAAEEAPESD